MTLSADFSAIPDSQHAAEIEQLCDAMEAADKAGRYSRLTVERPWSAHNRVLDGEFASPQAIRWYLERELGRLAANGASISVCPGREAVDLHDPKLGRAIDETQWDLQRKKLFLFGPERMALSIDRLRHYTGTEAESFQRYVLLTNYAWHVDEFRAALPDCTGPDSGGRQMPAWHHVRPGRSGVTMVNIGVGPSNAKTITDHLAVLRPDLVLMIGHCAGLRNHQEIGDLVLATAYMRDDRVLDDILPLSVPVVSGRASDPGPETRRAMLAVSWDTIRLFLHVLAATVWVGGQITLAALVPVMRGLGAAIPRAAARRFNQVAWPAFAVLVITGIWNIIAVRPQIHGSYETTLVVKLVVVAISGAAAGLHARARSPAGLATFGALTAISALAALFLGILLGS